MTDGAPLLGIAAAVLERIASGAAYVPEDRIPVEEAVRAYTLGAAYSAFAEAELGSREVGKWADFVVLDRDPFRVDPEELASLRVLRTVVGGQTVYEAPINARTVPARRLSLGRGAVRASADIMGAEVSGWRAWPSP